MDVDPWLVQIIPPMELALAFQFAAEVQLAAGAKPSFQCFDPGCAEQKLLTFMDILGNFLTFFTLEH